MIGDYAARCMRGIGTAVELPMPWFLSGSSLLVARLVPGGLVSGFALKGVASAVD